MPSMRGDSPPLGRGNGGTRAGKYASVLAICAAFLLINMIIGMNKLGKGEVTSPLHVVKQVRNCSLLRSNPRPSVSPTKLCEPS
mmetsp:Transcript_43713/g.137268  ORF Transcript_43713/g.137268 Transcript_43713/m.137268 type:complete len:84 (-) Transcript_43713:747-998(-)